MKQYLDLVKDVLDNGTYKDDRTGTGTISKFGYQMRFNLKDGFPLLTTKKIHFKSVVYELLWFIKGDTNIKFLVDHDVKIWNEWPFIKYQKEVDSNISMPEFIEKIKNDNNFAKQYGNLGPVYGKQWRDFDGVDQLSELLNNLKNNPFSRRHIISSWNPKEIKNMALPPCHTLMQFYVSSNNELSCNLYQRSADIFLGVPFNIASYSLLTCLIAQVLNFKLGSFVHSFGDCHIYQNHIEQVKLQLSREPLPLSHLVLNPNIKDLFSFKYEDIKLENYQSHSLIKGAVAV